MCNFASFSLTKDSEFWWHTESHADIDEHWNLHVDGARGPNVLHVEITPPEDNPTAPLDQWVYRLDQDVLPEWHEPVESERRARAALTRRAETERWLVTETVGDAGQCVCGYAGTATAGTRGTATAGYAGTATAGDAGTATAGYAGTATAGTRGTATAGYAGTATAGYAGTATAGDAGTVVVRWWDSAAERYRLAIGYVGEDGIDADKPYRWDSNKGRLVLAEPTP